MSVIYICLQLSDKNKYASLNAIQDEDEVCADNKLYNIS